MQNFEQLFKETFQSVLLNYNPDTSTFLTPQEIYDQFNSDDQITSTETTPSNFEIDYDGDVVMKSYSEVPTVTCNIDQKEYCDADVKIKRIKERKRSTGSKIKSRKQLVSPVDSPEGKVENKIVRTKKRASLFQKNSTANRKSINRLPASYEECIRNNNIDGIIFLHQVCKKTINNDDLSLAYFVGNQDIIKLLYKLHSKKFDNNTLIHAVRKGNLEMAKYLYNDLNCSLCPYIFYEATKNGYLEIAKWLLEQDCPINATAFIGAIESKNDEIIRWLAEINCPTNSSVFCKAVEISTLEIIIWLKEEVKCKVASTAYKAAIRRKDLDILNWFMENL